jgi:metal-responsive CopG/Arc/MetJ family transcriptional regulator
MYPEEMKLANFRLPMSLLERLPEAQHALGKPSVAELVRDALRTYLEENDPAIRAYRRLRERHGGEE